jgi:hypothetical protein
VRNGCEGGFAVVVGLKTNNGQNLPPFSKGVLRTVFPAILPLLVLTPTTVTGIEFFQIRLRTLLEIDKTGFALM